MQGAASIGHNSPKELQLPEEDWPGLERAAPRGGGDRGPGVAEIEACACGPRLRAAERQPMGGLWAQHGPRASLWALPAAARTLPCVEMHPV